MHGPVQGAEIETRQLPVVGMCAWCGPMESDTEDVFETGLCNQATLPGPRSSRSEISIGGRAGSCNDSGCAALVPVLFLLSI